MWLRIRRGDSGMLPIIVGLIALCIYFESRSSTFITVANLNNLVIQAIVFILLGMAEIWLLLLGEIDLSLGFVAGLSGAVSVVLVDLQFHWAWYLALPLAVLMATGIGIISGAIVIGLRLPSFIVTLAGQLAFQGILIWIVDSQGTGGTITLINPVLHDFVYGQASILWTIIIISATVLYLVAQLFLKNNNRRKRELDTTPNLILIIRAVMLVVAGACAIWLFDSNRGGKFIAIKGMPWAMVILGVMMGLSTFVLTRTKPGRYIYAIGGNLEAARRAGIRVNRYRLLAFALAGFTAGIAGLIYVSNLNGANDAIPGGTLVLYAVASAVIGGTSLFGGRGKLIHALIGGLVIATIYNGMALLSTSVYTQYIATAAVLVAAVTIDNTARRGSTIVR